METDRTARLKMIRTMLAGFPSSASGITELTPAAYLMALEGYSNQAVADACKYFLRPSSRTYPPPANELAQIAEMMSGGAHDPDDATDMRNLTGYPIGELPPPGMVPAGQVSIDYGHGRIDMRRLSHEEQERVFKTHRAPERIAADPARPNIKRMG